MIGFCKLDFSNGITFIALEPQDTDAFGLALSKQGVNFTRQSIDISVKMKDGSSGLANAEQLTIDPKAGSAFVLGIFQRMISDQQ